MLSLTTQQALAVVCGGLLLIPQIVGARDDLHTARTPFGVYSVDENYLAAVTSSDKRKLGSLLSLCAHWGVASVSLQTAGSPYAVCCKP